MNEKPLRNKSPYRLFLHGLMLTAWGMGHAFPAAAESMVALTGHVLPQLQSATQLGRASADEQVELRLVVKLDQDLLDETLNAIYGRNAPAKKHFLRSDEFARKFNLADKRQMLKSFAQANGLTVDTTEDQPGSMVVKVSGRTDAVEKTFNVHLNHYKNADGQVFRANETEPMIPESLIPHLGAVAGLSNITGVMHPHIMKSSNVSSGHFLTGTTGILGTGLAPNDIDQVYGLGFGFFGNGQKVALVEFDGYVPADITTYESAYGITPLTVTPVSINGATNTCGSGCDEVELDIEMVAAVAPGISEMLVYEAPNNLSNDIAMYNRIATDDSASVVSTSWGLEEVSLGASLRNSEAQIFQRMAAQGQSMYAASGDNGAYDNGSTVSVDDPASQPFVTGVGGTSLSGTLSSPTEVAWNTCGTGECLQSNGGSSGGGISKIWGLPDYQSGVSGLASQTARNVPDVALNADPNSAPYSVYIAGWKSFGGTSAAAPLWAAFTARVNQDRALSEEGPLGFMNTALYPLGTGSSYSSLFNDTLTGNNGSYTAARGYDNVTGFGSYKALALLDAFEPLPTSPGTTKTTLGNIFAYPNPWDARNPLDIGKPVTFANLPAGASVKIYTLSGFLVKSLPLPDDVGNSTWDLTNDSGQHVASGLYFYVCNTSVNKTTGTIAIIK